jgi:hypothetical protein
MSTDDGRHDRCTCSERMELVNTGWLPPSSTLVLFRLLAYWTVLATFRMDLTTQLLFQYLWKLPHRHNLKCALSSWGNFHLNILRYIYIITGYSICRKIFLHLFKWNVIFFLYPNNMVKYYIWIWFWILNQHAIPKYICSWFIFLLIWFLLRFASVLQYLWSPVIKKCWSGLFFPPNNSAWFAVSVMLIT